MEHHPCGHSPSWISGKYPITSLQSRPRFPWPHLIDLFDLHPTVQINGLHARDMYHNSFFKTCETHVWVNENRVANGHQFSHLIWPRFTQIYLALHLNRTRVYNDVWEAATWICIFLFFGVCINLMWISLTGWVSDYFFSVSLNDQPQQSSLWSYEGTLDFSSNFQFYPWFEARFSCLSKRQKSSNFQFCPWFAARFSRRRENGGAGEKWEGWGTLATWWTLQWRPVMAVELRWLPVVDWAQGEAASRAPWLPRSSR